MRNYLAAIDLGKLEGIGPLGLEGISASCAPGRFTLYLTGAIGLMTVIAAIWFTFNFIIGAIGIMTSGGDKGKVETSRSRITTGVIGLVIVLSAVFVVQLFGSLIGLDKIILRPTDLLGILAKLSTGEDLPPCETLPTP